MCDRRNLVQYNLMSIQPINGSEPENAVSEICRIAAIIYSVGVTFPLAGVGAPLESLVKMLKTELQKCNLLEIATLSPATDRLLLWVLMMGGIAAMDKSERPWFAAQLSNVINRSRLTHWKDLKSALKSTLWLDSACDMGGRDLWREACAIIPDASQTPVQEQDSQDPFSNRPSPCGHCQKRKIKCDNERPCRNCVDGELDCASKNVSNLERKMKHVFSTRQKPCDLCRKRRVRCDKGQPCTRCSGGGFKCVYTNPGTFSIST
jgi:hypothetical protein